MFFFSFFSLSITEYEECIFYTCYTPRWDLPVFLFCFFLFWLGFFFSVVCESCAVEMICITTNCKYPGHVLCVVISSLVHKYQRFNSFKLHPLCSLFTREAPAGSLQFFWPDLSFLLFLFCSYVCLDIFCFVPPPHTLYLAHVRLFPLQTKTMEPWAKLIPNPLLYTVTSSRRNLFSFIILFYLQLLTIR